VSDLLTQAAQQGQHEQTQQKAALAREVITAHDQRLQGVLDQLQLKPTQKKAIQAFIDQEITTLSRQASGATWLHAADDDLNQLNQLLHHQLAAERHLAQTHLTQMQALRDTIAAIESKLTKAASPKTTIASNPPAIAPACTSTNVNSPSNSIAAATPT
jgi:DNA sulfur modification protein DndD